MKLIFIRHGDPDYEKDSLTEKGWREAEILAKRVATWDIKQIYCSPLGRAKDTCSVSLKETGREAVTCDWLKEFYYRIWDEQVNEWTICWDFYPRDFNHRDDFHDKDKWYETDIMKSGNIKEHALEVFAGIDELLEKHGYKRNDKGFYDVLEHNLLPLRRYGAYYEPSYWCCGSGYLAGHDDGTDIYYSNGFGRAHTG